MNHFSAVLSIEDAYTHKESKTMKFIFEDEKEDKQPTFGDVEHNQFFVHQNCLMQKVDSRTANKIAIEDGTLYANGCYDIYPEIKIDRILPKVKKIEF